MLTSELLESTTFLLKNIALLDRGKAFEAEIHTRDTMAAGAFTKTLQEGPPTRPLLRADSFTPVGTIQLTPIKEGLRVQGRLWASAGLRVVTQPLAALELRYKPIRPGESVYTEVRLFSVALVREKNVAN